MNPHLFRFKQFSVLQEKSAMKIGTDSVLIGAWANTENPKSILDIGSGTGVVSLMLAQRFPEAKIIGIEIDEDAFSETRFNFIQSNFQNRCTVFHLAIQEFETEEKFDLIVSNPPFFEHTHQEKSARNTARQQAQLSFSELLAHTKRLLNKHGKAAFIIPFLSEENFLNLAQKSSLYPEKITHIRGTESSPVKRSMILLSAYETKTDYESLVIEVSRGVYTRDYIDLTKDFYLKM